MSTAFIFPGQGAQTAGMGKDFYESFEVSKKIFDRASELLNLDMRALCFEKNDRLDITEYTQAGLSLGEYCALVACKIISFEDALKTVRQRGIFMQEAVPSGVGAMCAVIGLDNSIIEEICDSVEEVFVANYNCPGQTVISGKKEAVETAAEKLKEAGAKRCMMLNVSGPFHSPLLSGAGEKLYEVLKNVELEETFDIPYLTNVTAEYVTDTKNIRELLKNQVSSSVMWQQSMEKMLENGVDTFVEIGPGKTLAGFMKRIKKDVRMMNISTVEDIEKAVEILG